MVICLNYVGAMLGISALSVGFTGQTGFTFKLVHGEKMSETIGHIELNRYVVQVFILTVVIYISLNTYQKPFKLHFTGLCYVHLLAYISTADPTRTKVTIDH